MSGIVLAELVMFLEGARYEENIAPVFKLADLVKLYESQLKQLQIETDEKVHSTWLKERLLKHLPDLRAHNKSRHVFLVVQNDTGATLAKVVEQDDDDDAVQLAHAEKLFRKIFLKSHLPLMALLEKDAKRIQFQNCYLL